MPFYKVTITHFTDEVLKGVDSLAGSKLHRKVVDLNTGRPAKGLPRWSWW